MTTRIPPRPAGEGPADRLLDCPPDRGLLIVDWRVWLRAAEDSPTADAAGSDIGGGAPRSAARGRVMPGGVAPASAAARGLPVSQDQRQAA